MTSQASPSPSSSSPSSSSVPHPEQSSSSPYPFAAAPDIIRAHQKDAYFTGVLTNTLADLHRRLLGARSAHAWAPETRTAADALYLCLTTLLGNRTLGEEYCDLVQVHDARSSSSSSSPPSANSGPVLPSLARRASYIASAVLLPHLAGRLLPSLRARLRAALEGRLADLARRGKSASPTYRAARYLAAHLSTLTSGAPFHAVALAVFYFSGAYYSLAKRATGLRYVFTRRVDPEAGGRAGYEVLGVLLVFQLAVQAYMHVRAVAASSDSSSSSERVAEVEAAVRERLSRDRRPVEVSLDHEHSYLSNNDLLLDNATAQQSGGSRLDVAAVTHTPVPPGGRARYDLASAAVMRWVKGSSQRKCTLCLEPLRDPAATQCGHVFCWVCIGDWVREKPECPLCRREALVQHILPLRAAG